MKHSPARPHRGREPDNVAPVEVLIVRHAESEPNVAGVISADPSRRSPLTQRGRHQAEDLGKRLVDQRIDLCVTSELDRAVATADIALGGRDVERQVMGELNDPKAGAFEGGSAIEHRDWLRTHGLAARNPGGGESQLDALRRYARGFRALADRSAERVLAVAHGMPIAWLRSARASRAAGGSEEPTADFADPGVDFAGVPDLIGGAELAEAAAILERFANRAR
jgi:broad specificity phosphatase PhoE